MNIDVYYCGFTPNIFGFDGPIGIVTEGTIEEWRMWKLP